MEAGLGGGGVSGGVPEAVVIGAGPAGAGAALRLAQRGVSAWLVDRRALPREKVCGGCLHRRGAARLGRWGVGEAVLEAAGAERLTRSEVVAGGRTLAWPRGHGWSVDRAAFDFALVRQGVERGVTLRDRTAARVQWEADGGWSVRLRKPGGVEEALRPTWVLVADGLGGSALTGERSERSAGFAVRRGVGSYVGAGVVLRGSIVDEGRLLAAGTVRMFVGEGGYVGAVRANAVPGRSIEEDGVELAAAMRPDLLKACGGAGAAAVRLLEDAGADAGLVEAVARRPEAWRV
ncbi:MAG: FAD-dependent monooxygenase, partial [Planctomycetota bacterium]